MWNLIRTLLVALALAGFIGQTSAHATPIQVFQAQDAASAMPGCAEAMQMADGMADGMAGKMGDCSKGMTGDCMAKMGCTTFVPPIVPPFVLSHLIAERPIVFTPVNETRTGLRPPPIHAPPKQQA